MESQQLITKLQELKKISPRKEWVALSKTQLFASNIVQVPQRALFTNIFAKRMAYSFATLLVVLAGTYGVMHFPVTPGVNVAKNATASLTMETDLKNNVEIFKIKSQNLSEVSKSTPANVSVALQEVKVAAKNVTEAIKKDPQLASKIALDVNNGGTYLNVVGGGKVSEVSDMYAALVIPLLKDLDEKTLTKEGRLEVDRIKAAFNNGGDSVVALRDILLISRASESK